MKLYLATVLFLAACSDSNGSSGVDAKVYMDAHINVPAMITISGIASQQATTGTTPAAGVVVSAYRTNDPNTAIANATTDSTGAYSLTITTNGAPLDGYLKATLTGNVDTYLYPPAPLIADFPNASVNELDTNTYGLLEDTLGGGQTGQGCIVLEVVDTTGAFVGGVAVSSNPASKKIGYTQNGSPLPNFSGTATETDGRAYLTGLAAGSVTVSATKSGATFKSHAVGVFAGAFTTTLITE